MFYDDDFFTSIERQAEDDYDMDTTVGTDYSGVFPENDEDDF